MKYIIATIIVVFGTHTYCARQDNHLIDQDLITYQSDSNNQSPITAIDVQIDQPTSQLSSITPLEKSIHFIMTIFNPQEANDNLKTVENMINSCINAIFKFIKANSSNPDITQDQFHQKLTDINPFINRFLGEFLKKRAHAFTFPIKQADNNSTPADHTFNEITQKVITCIVFIMQNFFTIVQDPESTDYVAPNVLEIFAGIVAIGTEAILNGLTNDPDTSLVTIINEKDYYGIIYENIIDDAQA